MEVIPHKFYQIDGKIYQAMSVNDNFPIQRFSECGFTISHRVFPNIENRVCQEVSEKEADKYYDDACAIATNWN